MYTKISLIILLSLFYGCKEHSWLMSAQSILETKYDTYLTNEYQNCAERDLNFDKQRKLNALRASNLDGLFNGFFKKQLTIESLDSIYIINTHAPHFEIEDYTPFVFVLLFENHKYDTYTIDMVEPYTMQSNDSPYPLSKLLESSNGCGYGYRVVTKIIDKNKWEIINFQLNPDEEVLQEK